VAVFLGGDLPREDPVAAKRAISRAVLALSKWIGGRTTVFVDAILKTAGTAVVTTAFLHTLHIDLAATAAAILSHLFH
jgi:hypothetical protein